MARRAGVGIWEMSPANRQQMHSAYRHLLRASTKPNYRTITLQQRQSPAFPLIDIAVMQSKMKVNIRTAFRVDRVESNDEFNSRMAGCSKLNEMLNQLYSLRLNEFLAMFRKVQQSQQEIQAKRVEKTKDRPTK